MAKILVVDDDKDLLEMFSVYLARKGWAVVKAETGELALSLARRESPDIVLCDVTLPDLDGFEVAKRLRAEARTSRIPLVLISGNRKEAEDVLKGLDEGSQAYILKPVDLRLVHAKLEAVLRAGKKAA